MTDTKTCIVGVDLGGTSIRAALVDADRVVLACTQTGTLPHARAIQNQVIGLVDALQASTGDTKTRVANICIGFPGVVHPRTQVVRQAPNILDAEMHNLTQQLSQALGLPVYLENDVNLAALAEQEARAGEGIRSAAMISIGTGLGCGLILQGNLWQGRDGGAGELGGLALSHPTRLFLAENAIGNGFHHAEDLVSGKGLAHLYGQLCERSDPKHAATQALDFRQVHRLFDLAEQGDTRAQKCLDLVASETAHIVELLEHMLNPALYVLAGGVGSRPEFRSRVNQALEPIGLLVQDSKFHGTDSSASYLDLKTAGLAGAVLTALSRMHAATGQVGQCVPSSNI